jgi:LysR family transcriptional regulator for bpeEF and oprC
VWGLPHYFDNTTQCRNINANSSSILVRGLQQFIAFAGTARHGGFAAAARELGTAPSTLAKAVARLEASLGVKLFHRTTRQVRLTPDGERLFQRCQRVLAEVEDLQAEAAGTRAQPSGTLHLSLPMFYGKRFVLPLLAALQRQHPQLQIDVRLSDAQVDLVREGIDLALRIGKLRDSTLVAQRVDRQQLLLCASTAYLAAHGMPQRIEDLAGHAAVVFRLPTTGRDRPWQLRQRGAEIELTPRAQLRLDDGEGLVEALKLGMGLCQLPDMMVQAELARGELVELLPSCRPEPMPIHIVHPSGRLLPQRVRVAIEALQALRRRERG